VSTPPVPPPPPPQSPYAPPLAGGTPPPGGERLPWEERDRLGFVEALIQTIRLLVTDPSNAFSRLRADGDLTSPILFGLILSWAGVLLSQVWQLMFGGLLGSMMSGMEGLEGAFGPSGAGGIIGTLFVWPVIFVVFLFISAGILHLCLMIVGATADSPTGFEGTLKVVSYSQVAGVASIVPLVGGFLFAIWALILEVIGSALVHRTTQGRALMGVLIPVLVCCTCGILVAVLFGAMIAAFIASLTGSGVSP
jgi:hypothetical protein